MSVRKLKSGKWIADVSVGERRDGSRDRRTKVCATKREAERAERAFLARKGSGLVSGLMTIDEFIEDVYWPAKEGLRANTKRGYERDIRLRILPALSGMRLEDIRHSDIQRMIDAAPTRKAATNARETLSSILGHAMDMEMIQRNPAGLRYVYPQPRKAARGSGYGEWLTTFEQHRRYFDAVESAQRHEMLDRIMVLGLCFGLRKGEVFGLDWEQVDMRRRTVSIMQTYVTAAGGAFMADPKTPRAVRTVPISSFAYARMESWDPNGRSGPIVRTRAGGRMSPSSGQDVVRRFADRHPELPRVTIHSMRHSFTTACVNAGVEVSRISAWLGHEDVSTTYNRYVRPLLDDLRSDVGAIDDAYGGR